jgi:hypothetical protein
VGVFILSLSIKVLERVYKVFEDGNGRIEKVPSCGGLLEGSGKLVFQRLDPLIGVIVGRL